MISLDVVFSLVLFLFEFASMLLWKKNSWTTLQKREITSSNCCLFPMSLLGAQIKCLTTFRLHKINRRFVGGLDKILWLFCSVSLQGTVLSFRPSLVYLVFPCLAQELQQFPKVKQRLCCFIATLNATFPLSKTIHFVRMSQLNTIVHVVTEWATDGNKLRLSWR